MPLVLPPMDLHLNLRKQTRILSGVGSGNLRSRIKARHNARCAEQGFQ